MTEVLAGDPITVSQCHFLHRKSGIETRRPCWTTPRDLSVTVEGLSGKPGGRYSNHWACKLLIKHSGVATRDLGTRSCSGYGVTFSGVKRQGRGGNHPPHLSPWLKKE